MERAVQSSSSMPFKRSVGDGEHYWHLGSLLSIRASGAATGGRYSVVDYLAASGPATPLHRHSDEDEMFFVHDGEIAFVVGDEVVEAVAGDFVHAGANVSHALVVRSDTARFTVVTVPAGFEQFFVETGEPAGYRDLPPPPATPPDVEALVAEAAKHRVAILGPAPDVGEKA